MHAENRFALYSAFRACWAMSCRSRRQPTKQVDTTFWTTGAARVLVVAAGVGGVAVVVAAGAGAAVVAVREEDLRDGIVAL